MLQANSCVYSEFQALWLRTPSPYSFNEKRYIRDLYKVAYTDFEQPDFKSTVIVSAYVQVGGVERAPAYNRFLALPAMMDTTKMTTVGAVVSEYDIAPQDH